MLEMLRERNPEIEILNVSDERFREYGQLLFYDAQELLESAEQIYKVQEGTGYEVSNSELEQLEIIWTISREIFGEFPVQAGCCYGYNTLLNGMEYHKSSEVIGAATDMVLLLGHLQDVNPELGWDSSLTEFFYLPEGTLIELYSTTLHLAPCRVTENQFTAVIILPRGTNLPLEGGSAGKLWMKNKWLLAHPEGQAAGSGAFIGVHGQNCRLQTLGKDVV